MKQPTKKSDYAAIASKVAMAFDLKEAVEFDPWRRVSEAHLVGMGLRTKFPVEDGWLFECMVDTKGICLYLSHERFKEGPSWPRSSIGVTWDDEILQHFPLQEGASLIFAKGLFHMEVGIEAINKALGLSISAHETLEWTLEMDNKITEAKTEEQMYQEFLSGLKVGSVVALPYSGREEYRLGAIERLTATQFVFKNNDRYRRDTGQCVGGGYGRLTEATPEIHAVVRHNNLSRRLNNTNFEPLSLDQLERIAAITKEGENR